MSSGKKESNYKTTPGIFEVQSILQRGRSDNEIFYLVKWKGYSEQEATWEPESNLNGCREAILQFENIIKRMEEEKSASQSASSKSKRKSKRDKPQQQLLNSKSKEIYNSSSSPSNPDQLKKSEIQSLTDGAKGKSEKKVIPQSLETSLPKVAPSLDTLSSNENDEFEPTTAQTIQTKISSSQLKLLHQQSKGNCSDDFKKTQITTTNQLNAPVNVKQQMKICDTLSIVDKSKQQLLERQREVPEILRINQRITKKNKKSLLEEGPEIIPKITKQQGSQAKEGQNQTDSKTNLKEQVEEINRNNLELCQAANSRLKVVKTQHPIIKNLSQRETLCDQQFKQLIIESLGRLDSRFKRDFKIHSDQFNIEDLGYFPTKFIDLSNPLFSSINQKLIKILLTKEQAHKLDNQGELLYCQIETLIKISDPKTQDQKFSWITAMKSYESDRKQMSQNCYFLKIDDMNSQTWKKKFRKFLVPNS